MGKASILESFRIAVDVLQKMAAEEERHAEQLDAISKGAGDRSYGVAAGLGIAACMIARILNRYGEGGQDAQINFSLHRDEKGVADQAGPGDREQRDLPAKM